MRDIIRVGDATSHGGRLATRSAVSAIAHRAVARVGHMCVCPIEGLQTCMIVEGDANVIVDGKPAAFDGHKTSCGATLISSVSTSGFG